MGAPPIAPILDAQDDAGWWVKPGPGYAPKYTGTDVEPDRPGAAGRGPGLRPDPGCLRVPP